MPGLSPSSFAAYLSHLLTCAAAVSQLRRLCEAPPGGLGLEMRGEARGRVLGPLDRRLHGMLEEVEEHIVALHGPSPPPASSPYASSRCLSSLSLLLSSSLPPVLAAASTLSLALPSTALAAFLPASPPPPPLRPGTLAHHELTVRVLDSLLESTVSQTHLPAPQGAAPHPPLAPAAFLASAARYVPWLSSFLLAGSLPPPPSSGGWGAATFVRALPSGDVELREPHHVPRFLAPHAARALRAGEALRAGRRFAAARGLPPPGGEGDGVSHGGGLEERLGGVDGGGGDVAGEVEGVVRE